MQPIIIMPHQRRRPWAISRGNSAATFADRTFLPNWGAARLFLVASLAAPPLTATAQSRRVLKPGGRLIFREHGKAPNESARRWQNRLNPPWGWIGGGRNLNRDIPALIEAAGFAIDDLETMYLPGTPRFAGFNYWGSARPG